MCQRQQGRRFVSNGPRARDIRTATGIDAKEPIRIYDGYIPGRSFQQSAEKIRAELERTGALLHQIHAHDGQLLHRELLVR
ncbi:hypothetical protein [Corynebacterium sp. Marseille-P3884]|uniref:hypothetical protein n=1 Tax=Corynebacterium sp. Marseille-P3884 TaxID=2495409 RepID=UPI001B344C6E|nr:hypothetical protein [Corynebacterium sp. Marseille-P3884]MBP3949172.1 hypothetical protein [Corynebacterium sp. Marseille-P3884]